MKPMLSRRRLAAACMLAVALPLTAAEPVSPLVQQVRERLADAPVLRGRFEQRKTLKGFKSPLVSRGDFLVAKERGVVWHTREPFESSLVVTRERLLSRQADGRVDTKVEARDEPGLRAVNEMLFALMAADLQTLAARFRIDGELQGAAGWRLVLTPREAALAQWLARVELEGERFVRSVKLAEAQGDASVIRFSEHAIAQSLSREEAARFD
ncbi:LolA family protein [Methylibium rhizosphaerae]|uniref:LolA family protein n=1 Tax=Methylibium rhizosphaerae TaxID=2570323 RepID=UPI001128E657|nr:outer membrane lipoprotein carrier protein LolA [Methylibium rhizosphaerae]